MAKITRSILPNGHITHPGGRRKTVCTSTCMAALGISPDSFKFSQNMDDMLRIMRRKFSVRSRLSTVGKDARTVGQLRAPIRKNKEETIAWLVLVPGHAILLDNEGETWVDTAPVKRDTRRPWAVFMVARKKGM